MHLAPDEHVLRGQRDLLVALAHVRAHGGQDLVLGQIDLRVEIRHAELAAAPAAGRHLDHAEGRALVRKQNLVARRRMRDVDLPRQLLPGQRLVEQRQRLFRFAAPLDDAVDAEVVEHVVLRDLPAARSADDDLEVRAPRMRLDVANIARVVGVDRLLRDPKIEVYTPAANVTPSGLCVETATTRVFGPMNASRSCG